MSGQFGSKAAQEAGRRAFETIMAFGWDISWKAPQQVPDDAWPRDIIALALDKFANAARQQALREAAVVAGFACLQAPDGGSPTEAEVQLCEEAQRRILALLEHEPSMDCWCDPVRDEEEPNVVIHHLDVITRPLA